MLEALLIAACVAGTSWAMAAIYLVPRLMVMYLARIDQVDYRKMNARIDTLDAKVQALCEDHVNDIMARRRG